MKKTGHENRIVALTLLILQEHPRKMNILVPHFYQSMASHHLLKIEVGFCGLSEEVSSPRLSPGRLCELVEARMSVIRI